MKLDLCDCYFSMDAMKLEAQTVPSSVKGQGPQSINALPTSPYPKCPVSAGGGSPGRTRNRRWHVLRLRSVTRKHIGW